MRSGEFFPAGIPHPSPNPPGNLREKKLGAGRPKGIQKKDWASLPLDESVGFQSKPSDIPILLNPRLAQQLENTSFCDRLSPVAGLWQIHSRWFRKKSSLR